MTNQAYPSLNDIEPSWADVAVTFAVSGGAALEMADIKSLKWSRKVEVGEMRGASGGRVMRRTTGSVSQEASATLYRSGVRKLIKGLMAQAQAQNLVRGNQVLISLVSFDITIQHTPSGETEIYETHIKGCRYLGDSDDMKEGNDADSIELTLNPIEIANIINGKEVVLL